MLSMTLGRLGKESHACRIAQHKTVYCSAQIANVCCTRWATVSVSPLRMIHRPCCLISATRPVHALFFPGVKKKTPPPFFFFQSFPPPPVPEPAQTESRRYSTVGRGNSDNSHRLWPDARWRHTGTPRSAASDSDGKRQFMRYRWRASISAEAKGSNRSAHRAARICLCFPCAPHSSANSA